MIINNIQDFLRPRPFAFFLLSIVYKVIYDCQILLLLPRKYIYGLSYGIDFNMDKVALAWIVFILISAISHNLVLKSTKPIATCIFLLLYLYYVPMSSAYYLNNATNGFLLLSSLFWVILCAIGCIRWVPSKGNTENPIIGLNYNKWIYYLFLLFIAICCITYSFRYNGLALTLNISNIYDARADFVGSSGMIESILMNFGGSIVVPVSMLYALKSKERILFVISLIAELAIFSIARQKMNIFIILIVIGIFAISKMKLTESFKYMIPIAFVAILMLSSLENLLLSSQFIFGTFIRRILYFPSWLNVLYYDFFSHHECLYWSQDVFMINRLAKMGLINSAYDQSVLELINNCYFSGFVPSPNTGLFAEAYMHFGIVGAILYPVVIVLLLTSIFKCISFFDKETQILVTFCVSLSLISLPVTSGIFCITYFLLIPVTLILRYITISKQKENRLPKGIEHGSNNG